MEGIEPQSVIIAVTVGGALLLGALGLFTGKITGSDSSSKTSGSSNLTKKSKKAKKKKKKAAAKKKPTTGTDTSDVSDVPVTKKPTKKATKAVKSSKTAAAEKIPEPEIPKKKKKRNKKKKKPVKVKSDSSGSDSDVSDFQPKPVRKKEAEIVKQSNAADFVGRDTPQELEGWETVPVKKKKSSASKDFSSSTSTSTGKTSEKKKQTKESVKIGDHVSVVLGEGGATIQNIQSMSGARVTLKRDTGVCLITGDEDSVAVAKQLIQSLVSNQSKHTFQVTSKLEKAILAKSDTRQTIREISGAKIDYDFGDSKDAPLKITITGDQDKVESAKSLVEDYLEGKTPQGADGIKRIQVSAFQGRILIGSKGSQINQLQKESGASVNIEFDDSAHAVVTVIGDEAQIESGFEMISDFLRRHNFSTAVELSLQARPVLMKLNGLRKEIPNLKIDVNVDRTQIVLTGSEDGVKAGRASLLTLIEKELGPPDLKPNEVMTTIDLGSAAGKVIGKARATLNNLLKNSPGAKVEIKQSTICYVFGSPAAVQKLSKEIEDIVAKHNDVVKKSQQEQQELQAASWVVLGETDAPTTKATGGSKFAVESDWGGFKLAQTQNW